MTGIQLTRAPELGEEIAALTGRVGAPVGLPGVLDDLDRRVRRSWAPGRAVAEAWAWERADRRDRRWWPQGVSSSAAAGALTGTDRAAGRRVLAISWYAKKRPGDPPDQVPGTRVTLLDLDARRYRHVLLVVPVVRDGLACVEPLRVHAGGIAWVGSWLHVAATARGFVSCHLDDLLRVPPAGPGSTPAADDLDTREHDYLLPVRLRFLGTADEGTDRLRFSFLSLAAESEPELVAGEYARGGRSTRLARFPLDPATGLPAVDEAGVCRPTAVEETGVEGMQGAVLVRNRLHLTTSHGPWWPGSVHVGGPGSRRRHRWATPMGPEDLTYWPDEDRLWSVSEHPYRRWVFAMERGWFDR